MKKKKSVGRIIVVMFLRSFFVVMILLAAGICSYMLTMKYYEVSDDNTDKDAVLDIVGDVTADAVSRNIIYSYDPATKIIDAIVIEILNTESGNLDFVTIPAESQITVSNEIYKRMCAAGADAPQIITLSLLNDYFGDDTAYEYGILLLEDYMGIDIGYYTSMENSVFNSMFTQSEETGCFRPSDQLVTEAQSAVQSDGLESFIKTKYASLTSNLKVKNKLKYIETYSKVNPAFIYTNVVPGAAAGGNYIIDAEAANVQYQTILSQPAYKVPQSDAANVSSKGKNIKVLNGSGTEGIAAAVKAILEDSGMTVVKIADNPEVIENTIIYVAEDGMGTDLLYHFDNAQIEVKELDEGIDIMVIVGSADKELINTRQY